MITLNKDNISKLSHISATDKELIQKELPEKVIQFGEGNFLRAYINWMIQQMNKQDLFNGRTVAIQPTPHGKVVPKLKKQDNLYTTILQGIEDGKEKQEIEINSSISRSINPYDEWEAFLSLAEKDSIEFIFSNTTEAGVVYMEEDYPVKESPLSFPAKLTALMHRRFIYAKGDPEAGFVIIPCELIEENGSLLQSIVIRLAKEWDLDEEFIQWVEKHNIFCNTLVDRIVPGFPRENLDEWEQKLGYQDILMAVGEPFHLFVIESDKELKNKLPFLEAGLNVKWGEVQPFREMKVSLLNAPHTLLFSVGFLSGLKTVREVMENPVSSSYVKRVIFKDILPLLSFEQEEKKAFADSVMERFQNPFVKHQLSDLGLNAVQKMKSRVFPLLNKHIELHQRVPDAFSFSIAALFHYYRPTTIHDGHFLSVKDGVEYKVRDDEVVLQTFMQFWQTEGSITIQEVLSNEKVWGRDLNQLPGMTRAVVHFFEAIEENGAKVAMKEMLNSAKPV
ncbi:tagaturonate reductase [Halobacillus sp. Marseille-Q1614]|uniref:tagaturonate reductase n=1 Tax=Halobacillus sp. Marseille-Q1614 TaxID=2709134 RepID=UPI00156E927C|nr:tagaturonate reductase [Halobacillus sp. Marseille-Q1614]